MEHHQKGMAYKWQRHFRETKTTVAYALMLFGICFAIPLLLLWPQRFSIEVFNSRLAYHLILDVHHYFTCNKNYIKFINDEPSEIEAIYSFYLFNVSNAPDVLQRGYKPTVVETGPFSYRKLTYKYEVSFDPVDSDTVTFKEYTMLEEISDNAACQAMYYQLEKSYSLLDDPCAGGKCDCKDPKSSITVVNPSFMKTMWQDSANDIMSRLSASVFDTIRNLMEKDFVTAVKYHLTAMAFEEIANFRQTQQLCKILSDAVNFLLSNETLALTLPELAANMENTTLYPPSGNCGLMTKYGISSCPLGVRDFMKSAYLQPQEQYLSRSQFPSIYPLLNSSLSFSWLNPTTGFPMWAGLAWCLKAVPFNAQYGYTMINKAECIHIETQIRTMWAAAYFGNTVTPLQMTATSAMVRAFASYIGKLLTTYAGVLTKLQYEEFSTTYNPVPCSPLGLECVWQFGYMKKYGGSNEALSDNVAYSLINMGTRGSIFPNNLFYDGNQASLFNSYQYCSHVLNSEIPYDKCQALEYTFNDALVIQPSGLWSSVYGKDYGVSPVNKPKLYAAYALQSDSTKDRFTQFSCNVTSLLFDVYPTSSAFHDEYVIRFLNKYKEPELQHNFTVGAWEELGWIQWGTGAVTKAVVGVRTVTQIIQDGMWKIGSPIYINDFIEYSSWAIKSGYPHAFLYNITQAKMLLYTLSSSDDSGIAFRTLVSYASTTFIGNGRDFVNGVGAVGDKTFITEINTGNFSCVGPQSRSCGVASEEFTSAFSHCDYIQNLYLACSLDTFIGNNWLTNCNYFETSMTSTSSGIQCDAYAVYGHPHPYNKTIGNIVYEMMYQYTLDLALKNGLWCRSYDKCNFDYGGLFRTTTVNAVLFEGYTDASVLQYLNLKHSQDGVSFYCTSNPLICGKRSLYCTDNRVTMLLPNGKSFNLDYRTTPKDEFFAPFFEISLQGDLLWRYSMNPVVAARSMRRAASEKVIKVTNPFWAAHPAWNSNDTEFNKYLQCQKRQFSGPPYLFNSCLTSLKTGMKRVNESLQMIVFHGNKSINHFLSGMPMAVNGSSDRLQYPMELWGGFPQYPYNIFGVKSNYSHQTDLSVFDKVHALRFDLTQASLRFSFQRDIPVQFPLSTSFHSGYTGTNYTTQEITMSRRFVEDSTTWNNLRQLGRPRDSYGMPYKIPVGMASMERIAGFPMYLGTPHAWGNKEWGGTEYSDVNGYEPFYFSQVSFSDYDPVTGRSLRQALRQQVMMRFERGPLTPTIISSQDRCLVPTRRFALGSGYGCFAYVPLFWTEDARVWHPETFFRTYDHFYARPDRVARLMYVGLGVGLFFVTAGLFLFLHERYYRNKFMQRVYID